MATAFQVLNGDALQRRTVDLRALRAQIGAIDGTARADGFETQLLNTQIPRGAVVEIIGAGRTQFMVKLLAERQKQADTLALWVEKEFSVYPLGLQQQGVDLSRLLFVESDKAAAWVLGQALQAQIFPIVIAADFTFDEKELRRFQLLSERSRATTFLLSDERRPSWVPQLVIEASLRGGHDEPAEQGAPSLHVAIVRQRGFS